MLTALAAALVLTAGLQSPQPPSTERSRAEVLARSGKTVEAMEIFVHLVEQEPGDVEARLWVARLEMRLGRLDEAEAGFRSVLHEHPADVDARIGLASVLIRRGKPEEALAILTDVERNTGENSDLLSALGRAYRRVGDDRRALDYLRRAHALSPGDPDITSGFEAVARVYGHSIAFDGFAQGGAPGASVQSGTIGGGVRVAPRLRLYGSARMQQGPDYSDALAGAGLIWRAARATTAEAYARGGPDNIALATSDLSGAFTHYAGVYELGAGVRRLSFPGTGVAAAFPTFAWDPGGRWRLDTRYIYTRSSFERTGQTRGDHSAMLRPTWRGWRRVAIDAVYAYGVESFELLTAERLGALGMQTVAAGMRIETPSLTMISTTWEHEMRSNRTTVDRFNLAIVQTIPMIDLLLEFERISIWMVWVGVFLALSMLCAVVTGRIAYAWHEERRHRFERQYGPLSALALEGDEDARRALMLCPSRYHFALATLLITPLIDNRDPARIAATRTLVRDLSPGRFADRFLRSRWWWRRALALRALGLIQATDRTDVIIAALDDGHPEVRGAALDALADMQDPRSLPAIVMRLHDASLQRGRRAAALAAFGSQCEPLVLDLARVDGEHRLNYARVLAVCGTVRSRPALVRWTRDARPDVRAAAFEALAHIGLDEPSAALAIDALESSDMPVRAMAAGALRGWTGAGNAPSHLAPHLNDTWTVAVKAARSLQSMHQAGRAMLESWAVRPDLAGVLSRQMLWEGARP